MLIDCLIIDGYVNKRLDVFLSRRKRGFFNVRHGSTERTYNMKKKSKLSLREREDTHNKSGRTTREGGGKPPEPLIIVAFFLYKLEKWTNKKLNHALGPRGAGIPPRP